MPGRKAAAAVLAPRAVRTEGISEDRTWPVVGAPESADGQPHQNEKQATDAQRPESDRTRGTQGQCLLVQSCGWHRLGGHTASSAAKTDFTVHKLPAHQPSLETKKPRARWTTCRKTTLNLPPC